MLVLMRKTDEEIIIRGKSRIGVTADKDITVDREEVDGVRRGEA